MPLEAFFKAYSSLPVAQEGPSESRNLPLTQNLLNSCTPKGKLRMNLRRLSMERCFINYDAGFVANIKSSSKPTSRNVTPKRVVRKKPKQKSQNSKVTYVQLHNQRSAYSKKKRKFSWTIKLN